MPARAWLPLGFGRDDPRRRRRHLPGSRPRREAPEMIERKAAPPKLWNGRQRTIERFGSPTMRWRDRCDREAELAAVFPEAQFMRRGRVADPDLDFDRRVVRAARRQGRRNDAAGSGAAGVFARPGKLKTARLLGADLDLEHRERRRPLVPTTPCRPRRSRRRTPSR
jgi:hypothetical protein